MYTYTYIIYIYTYLCVYIYIHCLCSYRSSIRDVHQFIIGNVLNRADIRESRIACWLIQRHKRTDTCMYLQIIAQSSMTIVI